MVNFNKRTLKIIKNFTIMPIMWILLPIFANVNLFICSQDMEMSYLMNKNFKVKFNRLLVGYSGLCNRIGKLRADSLINKMLRTSCQSKAFKVSGNVVKFYCY